MEICENLTLGFLYFELSALKDVLFLCQIHVYLLLALPFPLLQPHHCIIKMFVSAQ